MRHEKNQRSQNTLRPYRYEIPEHDACGIGLVANIDGRREYRTLDDALTIVEKLEHRAGKDASGEVGDGVGILLQISHQQRVKAFPLLRPCGEKENTASACSTSRRIAGSSAWACGCLR